MLQLSLLLKKSLTRRGTTRDVELAVMLAPDKTWEEVAAFLTSRLRKRIAVQRRSARTNIKEKISFREYFENASRL